MGRLVEFPNIVRPGFRPSATTAEQIIQELAPSIQDEAQLAEMLLQVPEERRSDVEACLRQHGACKPEAPTC